MSKKKNKNTTQIQEPEEPVYESILGDSDDGYFEETEPTPEEQPELTPEEQEAQREKQIRKKKTLTALGISVASVLLVGCLAYAATGIYQKSKTEVAASSENVTISKQVMTCYYQDVIDLYVSYYGEDNLLTYYGLDVSEPLADQVYPYDETITWYDIIMGYAMDTVEEQLYMYEAALAAGLELTEDEISQIEEVIAETDLEAYGNDVTEDDLRYELEIQVLSTAYYNQFINETTFTDEEIEAYFEENSLDYISCDLAGFSVSYSEDGEEGYLTQEEALALAEKLEACTTPQEFEDICREYLIEYEDYDDEELEEQVSSIYYEGYTYTSGSTLSEWCFEADTYDTYLVESTSIYYIYMVTKSAYRDESDTVNVRHILIMSEDDNLSCAEEIYEEWLASGDTSEESFAALAEIYSEDTGSNTNGGLYENVYVGEMVDAFNDWCFDESRQAGDTGIIETSYGVHIMYFSGVDDPLWKVNIRDDMLTTAYTEYSAELAETYPITFDEEVVYSIEG